MIYAFETASLNNATVSKLFNLLISTGSGHWDCPQGRKKEVGSQGQYEKHRKRHILFRVEVRISKGHR
jgi:hypothetical protein